MNLEQVLPQLCKIPLSCDACQNECNPEQNAMFFSLPPWMRPSVLCLALLCCACSCWRGGGCTGCGRFCSAAAGRAPSPAAPAAAAFRKRMHSTTVDESAGESSLAGQISAVFFLLRRGGTAGGILTFFLAGGRPPPRGRVAQAPAAARRVDTGHQ